jgi:cytochrome c553
MKKHFGLLVISSFGSINTTQAEGDIEMGRALSSQCSSCHGDAGISNVDIYPNIAGQKLNYLIEQLEKYKSGDRKNPTMEAIVGPLTSQDIEDLAAYFYSNKPIPTYSPLTGILDLQFVGVDTQLFKAQMSVFSDDPFTLKLDSFSGR